MSTTAEIIEAMTVSMRIANATNKALHCEIDDLEQKLAVAVEALGMIDAVGMPAPYDKIVREALAIINPDAQKEPES